MRRNVHRTARALIVGVFCVGLAERSAAQPAPGDPAAGRPEIRAVWVDAFHAGIRSPAEADQLIADARRVHLNTLIVQVRRRGDALFTGGLEPPLDDPHYDPAFDALAYVVEHGHAAGLQVHAWINAMPVWRDEAPPADPRHVFNRHGPLAQGDACWLTAARDGTQTFPVGYFLDPGHPAARDHLVAVYLDIVRRYPVDGIHFDYIRYPETEGAAPARGADVGYNAVSVARFQRATGRTDVPMPDDEVWSAWRREQVTQLVRRISIEARAINPRIKVSAASIAWGAPPARLKDFGRASPMQRVFQNWQAWLAEGLLDLAVPMNYAREHDERVRGWFNGWIAFEKKHKGGRQIAVGIGGYLSAPEGVLAQVRRARAPEGRFRADGVSFFSYFQPSSAAAPPADTSRTGAAAIRPAPERLDFLVNRSGSSGGAFGAPAPVPVMPWIEYPDRGFVAGTVRSSDGRGVESVVVEVRRTGWFHRTRRVTTDANGWFGLTKLAPGMYRIRLKGETGSVHVEVTAGMVARADLTSR